MMKLFLPFLLLLGSTLRADDNVAEFLQEVSVTIAAGDSQGSGVLIVRGDQTFVLTAAHVIQVLRKTREAVDHKTGTYKTIVEFDDAKVIRTTIEQGRTVGRSEFDAQVVRYSDNETGQDLALLRIRKKGFATCGVRFYLDDSIPTIGTTLLHVGSMHGEVGSNSMTTGIISQVGRLRGKNVFDQISCPGFSGSSGGGVFLPDGRYVGCFVRTRGETFNLIAPVRRIVEWARRAEVLWAIDPSVPMPSAEELQKLPVEDIGVTFEATAERR
jgi:S1-C subfamily serine protease